MPYSFGLKSRDRFPESFGLYLPPDEALAAPLPASWDYRYLFGLPEDQGDFSTCVAFSLRTLINGIVQKRTGVNPEASWRGIYSLTKHAFESDDLADDGLVIEDALQALISYGYPVESLWPDAGTSELTLLEPVPETALVKTHGPVSFARVAISEDTFKRAIVHNGPIVIGLEWPEDWLNGVGSDGLLPIVPLNSIPAGGHCVVLTGYQTHKDQAYFELRNSWGTKWGARGFGWLSAQSLGAITNAYTAIIP